MCLLTDKKQNKGTLYEALVVGKQLVLLSLTCILSSAVSAVGAARGSGSWCCLVGPAHWLEDLGSCGCLLGPRFPRRLKIRDNASPGPKVNLESENKAVIECDFPKWLVKKEHDHFFFTL